VRSFGLADRLLNLTLLLGSLITLR